MALEKYPKNQKSKSTLIIHQKFSIYYFCCNEKNLKLIKQKTYWEKKKNMQTQRRSKLTDNKSQSICKKKKKPI